MTWSGSQWAPAAPTGGSGGIIIKEEGSQVAAVITSLDFVGSTVSATASGTDTNGLLRLEGIMAADLTMTADADASFTVS